ncbi:hypothetical protein [Mycobacterium sp.]|uniref:hypothetical protein n=1 Tax=Mycobacterium sp. TaxID=1785 RepID=UPI002DB196AD|nr:hypothetical protein [Mycobacterium sp.]
MAKVPNRLSAAAAVSVTAALFLTFPPQAMADEGAADGAGAAEGGTQDAGTATGGTDTTVTTPAPGSAAAADPIGEALGSLVKSIFGNGRTSTPAPAGSGGLDPTAAPVEAATPAEPVASAAPAEPAPAPAEAAAASEAAVLAAADPAAPADPWTDLINWWRGCTCEHEVEPPPPPPPPPDEEEEGWGLPIGFPGVPSIKTNKKGCGPYVPGLAVPPAPPGVVSPPVVPPVAPPLGGAPLVGGGGAPVFLAGGGGPAVFAPATYDEGLTFLTGVEDDNQLQALPIVVSSIIVSVGGGYLLWRRNAERPAGRHRRHGTTDRALDGRLRG